MMVVSMTSSFLSAYTFHSRNYGNFQLLLGERSKLHIDELNEKKICMYDTTIPISRVQTWAHFPRPHVVHYLL